LFGIAGFSQFFGRVYVETQEEINGYLRAEILIFRE
jgi:hypothetical protein